MNELTHFVPISQFISTIFSINSQRRCSLKKDVLKNFAMFTGKRLRWSLFLKKFKKETPTQMFSCECYEFLTTPILKNICEWLFLQNTGAFVVNQWKARK